MNLSELNNVTAYVKNSPIISPEQIDREKLEWNKMDKEWLDTIRKSGKFWFTEYKFNPKDFLPNQLPHVQKTLELRDLLLKFGGEQACMPIIEPDISNIISRGQFWYGDITKIKKGQPCQCHENSAILWRMDKENTKLVTGYALSKDGMWRQHSWCVQIRARKNIIIETTEQRIGYFGFVLTDEEAENFGF